MSYHSFEHDYLFKCHIHVLSLHNPKAYDVTGYCYYLEDGVEEQNTISYNLAAFIHMLATPAFGFAQTTPIVYQSATLTLPADVRKIVLNSSSFVA